MGQQLLSVSADAKTTKGEKIGVLTGILYLAPHDTSGHQVCPKATSGCKKACLYSAGRSVAYPHINEARIRKTRLLFSNRPLFMSILYKNIQSLATKAAKQKMIPAVRLNGTSDIAWEKIGFEMDGTKYKNIMVAFPSVQFYDYTKVLGRRTALSLSNYHLTFSLTENNDKAAKRALGTGYNLAVVLNLKKSDPKPATFWGYPVIDGDKSDVRFNDDQGHIVALSAKGKARRDTTGFVRQPS